MTQKIIVRLVGGLGNQLFGYCAARRLSVVNNCELVIDRETGFARDGLYKRSYNLEPFAIAGRPATRAEMLKPFDKYRRAILIRSDFKRPFTERRMIVQKQHGFAPCLLNVQPKNTLWIKGVWASENYFKDIEALIRKDLIITPPTDNANQQTQSKIKTVNSVALHLRFFSQKDDPTNMNASISYYQRAIKLVRERIPNPHFFVFSDKAGQARKVLPELEALNSTFVSHNNSDSIAYADMWLISLCKHSIMANSTFSWWGSWLGNAEVKGGLVICPDPEILGLANWNIEGMIPERWIKI